jgi:hypothetical protein
MTPTTVAVLPVKRWGDAKRRLGTTGLSDGTRRSAIRTSVTIASASASTRRSW